MKLKNWEGVFDITSFENDLTIRGDTIQATFWELRKDQIRSVRKFSGSTQKPGYLI